MCESIAFSCTIELMYKPLLAALFAFIAVNTGILFMWFAAVIITAIISHNNRDTMRGKTQLFHSCCDLLPNTWRLFDPLTLDYFTAGYSFLRDRILLLHTLYCRSLQHVNGAREEEWDWPVVWSSWCPHGRDPVLVLCHCVLICFNCYLTTVLCSVVTNRFWASKIMPVL